MKNFTAKLCAFLLLTGCLQNSASENSACSHNLSATQLRQVGTANVDMGNGNVGMFKENEKSSSPQFTLLNCKTAEFATLNYGSDFLELKSLMADLSEQGHTSTVDKFSTALPAIQGATVAKGQAPRDETSRHGCACITYYRSEWYAGFPKDFVLGTIDAR